MEEIYRDIEFARSKIYEKLSYIPEPENYNGKISWVVQNQIAATNGIHYMNLIGTLDEYPQYNLPVKAVQGNHLMLDIGCGWGRWLVAGANKGYLPVGVDLRLEFCETSQNVLKDHNRAGYVVVADLEELPFKDNLFDLVWSFSVIQHTHLIKMENCLKAIGNILSVDGYACLEFPNRNGIRNRMGSVQANEKHWDDYNNWAVRYYSVNEYVQIISKYLDDIKYVTHSFLGIGVLKDDLKYMKLKNKILCSISLLFTELTKAIPPLKNLADSLYFSGGKKKDGSENFDLSDFYSTHHANPNDNLNIVPLLKCPKYGGNLTLSSDRKKVTAEGAGIYYPIINGIPILISSEALISEI